MKNVTGNTMVMNHFVDFYCLEALRAGITMSKSANPDYLFRRSVEKLESDVNEAFDTLCETMALRIYVYLWGAALGEAQYAGEYCETQIDELTDFSYRNAFDFFPTEHNVKMVKEIFGQYWSCSGYGGKKWKEIVEGMELYGKITNAAFIDHAVDLEHNGGCVFDKTNSSPFLMNCFDYNFGARELRSFLNFKFSGDILNGRKDYRVSRKVFSLVNRYSNVIEKIESVDYLVPELEWLSPYTVEWNDYGENEFSVTDADNGVECENCGCKVNEDDIYYVNDSNLCSDCVEQCEHCMEYVNKNDTQYIDGENETWCDECAMKHKTCCDECGKDFHYENTYATEDDYCVCDNCKQECEECGEIHFDMEYHMEHEHAKEEGDDFPLPFDADGVFEIVDEWIEPYKLVIENISLFNESPVKMFVRHVTGTSLKIINLSTYNYLHKKKCKSDKYVIVIPCGLYFTKHSQPDLETTLKIAQESAKLIDWSKIQTIEDWNKVDDQTQMAIRKLI